MISFEVLGSNAAVCSSKSKICGFETLAITNARACLCPPDKYPTSTSKYFFKSREIQSSSSSNFSVLWRRHFFRFKSFPLFKASDRFSLTVIDEQAPAAGSWNTLLIILVLLCSGKFVRLILSKVISPELSGTMPEIIFNKVDLPVPLLPIMLTNSPLLISNERFESTVLGSPYGLGKRFDKQLIFNI